MDKICWRRAAYGEIAKIGKAAALCGLLKGGKKQTQGFKILDQNLSAQGIQFEIGRTYEIKNHIDIYSYGFDFFLHLYDGFNYYDFTTTKNRVVLVTALGDVKCAGNRAATNKIKIERELTLQEISNSLYPYENVGYFNTGDYNTGEMKRGYFRFYFDFN